MQSFSMRQADCMLEKLGPAMAPPDGVALGVGASVPRHRTFWPSLGSPHIYVGDEEPPHHP